MAIDMYAACPCGSGKKFKWCCQAFYSEIERAFTQQQNGQHETSLQIMEQLSEQYPQSAEVWGRRAELLWENDQLPKAEECIGKALEANPDYAFGHFLRAMFRHEEGELRGARALYRQAAALCDPAVPGTFDEIHTNLGQVEMLLGHPVAALAAWEIARRRNPQNDYLQERFKEAGEQFPPIVLKERRFKPSTQPAAKQAWEQALAGAQTGKLNDAEQAFAQITGAHPDEPAGWYNLGLVRAWLGENAEAIDALEHYVEREPDEDHAADAWAFAECLRFGDGIAERSDYIEQVATYPIRDAQGLAEKLQGERRLTDLQQQQGVIGGALLDREPPTPHPDFALFELPQVAGHFVIVGMRELRIYHGDKELFAKGQQLIQEIAGPTVGEPQLLTRPCGFQQVASYMMPIRLPNGLTDEQAKRLLDGRIQQFFEEYWLQKPLKSLNGITPIDAAGHAGLRKKLLGVVRFLEDLVPFPYDFDRLRHKLSLPLRGSAPGGPPAEISAMSAAELGGLEVSQLSDTQLYDAFIAAKRLDAADLAEHFALKLSDHTGEPADRSAVYSFLAETAASDGDFDEAHGWLESGLKHDCERNEGKHRNAFELRRAKLHVQAKEGDKAYESFKGLTERVPSDLDVLGAGAEAMLRLGNRDRAAEFAEKGLGVAKQKDRGRVGEFEEMLKAARK